jgi:hypothetical protein
MSTPATAAAAATTTTLGTATISALWPHRGLPRGLPQPCRGPPHRRAPPPPPRAAWRAAARPARHPPRHSRRSATARAPPQAWRQGAAGDGRHSAHLSLAEAPPAAASAGPPRPPPAARALAPPAHHKNCLRFPYYSTLLQSRHPPAPVAIPPGAQRCVAGADAAAAARRSRVPAKAAHREVDEAQQAALGVRVVLRQRHPLVADHALLRHRRRAPRPAPGPLPRAAGQARRQAPVTILRRAASQPHSACGDNGVAKMWNRRRISVSSCL